MLLLLFAIVISCSASTPCPNDDSCAGTQHVLTGKCNLTTGICTITECESGHGDCNGAWLDGCEIETASDPENCASCGRQCFRDVFNSTYPPSTLSLACSLGVCRPGTCRPNMERCPDDAPSLGCHINKLDPITCGGCFCHNCYATRRPGVDIYECNSNAECIIHSCYPGFNDCDGLRETGCESQLPCCPPACGAGFRCNTTTHACERDCVGVECCGNATTIENCGACAHNCYEHANVSIHIHVSQWACVKSHCAAAYCDASLWRVCGVRDTFCTDTNTDVRNCGFCNVICGVGDRFVPAANAHVLEWGCVDGECGPRECMPGWSNCDAQAWSGCETPGTRCIPPNPPRSLTPAIIQFQATATGSLPAAPAPATSMLVDMIPDASTKSASQRGGGHALAFALVGLVFIQ